MFVMHRRGICVWILVFRWAAAFAQGAANGCSQWSQRTALSNSTIYAYGGLASVSDDDGDNYNWFHALDISKAFNVTSPPLTGITLPSFPPGGPLATGVGALWPSSDGEFLDLFGSDFGNSTLSSLLLWRYNVSANSWSVIETSGVEQVPPVDGAGCSIPRHGTNKNGIGVYLGGLIPQNASEAVAEEYVSSTLLFDMDFENFSRIAFPRPLPPDYVPSPGRANGALVYIPTLGTNAEGILVSLGGGTNTTMIRMDLLDIFDIATQTWTKQQTHGPSPSSRISPCAVVASTSKSQQNIYMYGGQSIYNSAPFDDMWILSLPNLTWIQAPQSGDIPSGRMGHTCHAIGSEMVVLGGWTSAGICEVADLHIFNMSSLTWETTFSPNSTYSLPEIVVAAIDEADDITIEPVETVATTSSKTTSRSHSTSVRPTSTSSISKSVTVSSFTSTSLSTIRIHSASNTVSTEIVTITTVIATTTELIPSSTFTSSDPTSRIPNSKLGAIIGGSLGGFVLLLSSAFVFFVFSRRRREFKKVASDTPPEGTRTSYFENGGSAETVGQMSEWDISQWDGDVLLSPRQSLRVVNE